MIINEDVSLKTADALFTKTIVSSYSQPTINNQRVAEVNAGHY
jgi:hypothetical protein